MGTFGIKPPKIRIINPAVQRLARDHVDQSADKLRQHFMVGKTSAYAQRGLPKQLSEQPVPSELMVMGNII